VLAAAPGIRRNNCCGQQAVAGDEQGSGDGRHPANVSEIRLVGTRWRFEHVPHSHQATSEVRAQIEAIGGLAHGRTFGKPDLLGLPQAIVVLFAGDEFG
jgi:hypothetical protein